MNNNEPSELMVNFGKRVKHFRTLSGMSQEELAKKLGYKSKASIAHIEAGTTKVQAYKVIDFAQVLGVSVAELMQIELFEYSEVDHQFIAKKEDTRNRDTIIRETLELLLKLDINQLEKAQTILNTMYGE